MTHDFAKKPKANKNKKSRSNNGSSTNRTKSRPKSQVPGWVWLFTGIVAGLFISFLGYLADITPSSSDSPITKKQTTEKATKQEPTHTTSFEFYTLLPEREVIVPVEQESESDKAQKKLIYILQAGSFKNASDADRLRAKLILLGLDTKVEAVTGKGKGTWHRVQVGPFSSRSKLSKARNTLISNNIETLLLKRKIEG